MIWPLALVVHHPISNLKSTVRRLFASYRVPRPEIKVADGGGQATITPEGRVKVVD